MNIPNVFAYLICIVQHRHVRMTENKLGRNFLKKLHWLDWLSFCYIQSFWVLPLILNNIEICIGKIVATGSINMKYCSIKICHWQTFHCRDALSNVRIASLHLGSLHLRAEMAFRAETFSKEFWHLAKTFGMKCYFGTQMNRPLVLMKSSRIEVWHASRRSKLVMVAPFGTSIVGPCPATQTPRCDCLTHSFKFVIVCSSVQLHNTVYD